MSKGEKFVAYVGTYTLAKSIGIYVYDVDAETGVLKEKQVVPISNASDITVSKDHKFLYSIEDEGVASFKINTDGTLEQINSASIGGMRGDTLIVDSEKRFLFVGGYHDGKITVLRINEDRSVGDICYSLFHQGLSQGFGERHRSSAKVTTLAFTPDEKFLCAVDLGLNQIKVYEIDYTTGHLSLSLIVRPEIGAGCRTIKFSSDGRFAYVLGGYSNRLEVYAYKLEDGEPVFERIQEIDVMLKGNDDSASCNLVFDDDETHVAISVDGLNGVCFHERDPKTGMLSQKFQTLSSGDFPKSLAMLPGGRFVSVLNHDTDEIRSFEINYKDGFSLQKSAPVKISKPNCILTMKL